MNILNITTILCFLITISLYFTAKLYYKRTPKIYFSPLLTVPVIIAVLLLTANIPYDTYKNGTKWLNIMLQPATIAFAVPLYKYRAILKKNALEIILSVFLGSVTAMISSVWIAEGLNIDKQLISSLIPRSVTTPIAMDISQLIGGVPSITAVIVIMTGLLGSVIGPWVIRFFKIEGEIARGVLFGTSSHAVGTSKAFEFSTTTGTVSSLSMILAAIITVCTVQFIIPIIIF